MVNTTFSVTVSARVTSLLRKLLLFVRNKQTEAVTHSIIHLRQDSCRYGDHWATGIWDWLKLNKDEIDVAYLNRPHIATKYVDFIKENTNIKVIYYGHDLHFLRLGREYELTGDIDIKREADYWKAIELSMMRKAAISYYPSYVEINVIHSIDASIRAKASPSMSTTPSRRS